MSMQCAWTVALSSRAWLRVVTEGMNANRLVGFQGIVSTIVVDDQVSYFEFELRVFITRSLS